MLYVMLSTLREIVQIYQQRYHYLMEPINFVSWLLYIAAFIMVSPVFMVKTSFLGEICHEIHLHNFIVSERTQMRFSLFGSCIDSFPFMVQSATASATI